MFDDAGVHPPHLRERALRLRSEGVAFGDICNDLELPRRTVGHRFYGERARRREEREAKPSQCVICAPRAGAPRDPLAYSYLLGFYLGDGHLVTSIKVPVLRIHCTATWPGIVAECRQAMLDVLAKKVHQVTRTRCVAVQSYSNHWPCSFPQHGPGRKHERAIALAPWQNNIVGAHPGPFLRGLFHSDGCRLEKRVTHGTKTYTYPRYNLSNESADIMGLCQASLDRLGISWRMCRPDMLSVARREAVAELDRHVGPKW